MEYSIAYKRHRACIYSRSKMYILKTVEYSRHMGPYLRLIEGPAVCGVSCACSSHARLASQVDEQGCRGTYLTHTAEPTGERI